MGRKSINQLLKSLASPQAREGVSLRWVQEWQTDHDNMIGMLERSANNDDYDNFCKAIGRLKELHRKRFDALPGIITELTKEPGMRLSKQAIEHDQYSQADLAKLLNVTAGAINDRKIRGTLPPYDGETESGRGWWRYETIEPLIKGDD